MSNKDECIPCLGLRAKQILLESGEFNDSEVATIIDMPECEETHTINICKIPGKFVRRKPKRAPTAYNIFIKDCMKEEKEKGNTPTLTACAAEWKGKK